MSEPMYHIDDDGNEWWQCTKCDEENENCEMICELCGFNHIDKK